MSHDYARPRLLCLDLDLSLILRPRWILLWSYIPPYHTLPHIRRGLAYPSFLFSLSVAFILLFDSLFYNSLLTDKHADKSDLRFFFELDFTKAIYEQIEQRAIPHS